MNSGNQQLEFSHFSSEIILSHVRQTIGKILNSKNYKLNVSLVTEIGEDNFIGVIYRISFGLLDETKNGQKLTHNLIAKIAPCDLEYRNIWCPRPCFMREIYMYDEVMHSNIP